MFLSSFWLRVSLPHFYLCAETLIFNLVWKLTLFCDTRIFFKFIYSSFHKSIIPVAIIKVLWMEISSLSCVLVVGIQPFSDCPCFQNGFILLNEKNSFLLGLEIWVEQILFTFPKILFQRLSSRISRVKFQRGKVLLQTFTDFLFSETLWNFRTTETLSRQNFLQLFSRQKYC